jgi:hypothetical protein
MPSPERPWWQIPDFDPVVGDIKLIWELSRMDWVLALAQRARQAEPGALDRLNAWLNDWCMLNPPLSWAKLEMRAGSIDTGYALGLCSTGVGSGE